MKVAVILPAAGLGTRMGKGTAEKAGTSRKQFMLLEGAPILIAGAVLVATARRFPLTPLAYRLIFVHALILMLGGHYTNAEVPLGDWVADALGLTRNP